MSKSSSSQSPLVGILMGSQSDLEIMSGSADMLEQLGVSYELNVISAHRAPKLLVEYMEKANARGLKVMIAGAGGAAHLPGVVAALTTMPVIGVPVKSSLSLDGWDSILSILQMPEGVPVATVAVNGARNAGILAAQIVGASDASVAANLKKHKQSLHDKIQKAYAETAELGFRAVLARKK